MIQPAQVLAHVVSHLSKIMSQSEQEVVMYYGRINSLSLRVALFSGLAHPFGAELLVLGYATAVQVHETEPMLRFGLPLCRSLAVPLDSGSLVLSKAARSLGVEPADAEPRKLAIIT